MEQIAALLDRDPLRRRALTVVAGLQLPDCWIGAGFIRDAVWDHLHGFGPAPPAGDVDVVWFDRTITDAASDQRLEGVLQSAMPELAWSVKNQARMHLGNGDALYQSVADAMRHWPETATAIAARMTGAGSIEINAPFSLNDLFALTLRPTPSFAGAKRRIFEDRIARKLWLQRYPRLVAL